MRGATGEYEATMKLPCCRYRILFAFGDLAGTEHICRMLQTLPCLWVKQDTCNIRENDVS